MKIVKGSAGGIVFRSTGSASYYFRINQQNRTYALFACAGAGTSCNTIVIPSNSFSSEIVTGLDQSNTIAVVAKGNSIQLYVNGARINEVDGSNASISLHGQIGLVADSSSEVVFNNARVWTA